MYNVNKQRNHSIFFLSISLFCCFVMIGDVLFSFTGNIITLTSSFILGYLFIILRQLLIGNFYSLYSFYLLTSAFFMYDIFLIGPYLGKGVMSIDFAGMYTFPDWVGEKFIFIASFSIIVVDIIYTTYHSNETYLNGDVKYSTNIAPYNRIETNKFYYRFGMILMCIFIIPLIYKIILQVKEQKLYASYSIANFTGIESTINFPWWTRGSGTFFYIGFLLFIYSFPSIRKAKIGYFLYLILLFSTALKGGRAFLFSFVLSLPLLLKKLYNKTISKVSMIFLSIVLIILATYLGNFRTNSNTTLKKGVFANFLYGQTTTMGVPYIYLNNDGNIPYKHYPLILTPLINPIRRKFVTYGVGAIESMKQSNNYGTIELYMINPTAVENGGGLGLNFLTEAYDFLGYIGVFLWSVLLAIIMRFVDSIQYSNKNRRLIVIIFFIYDYILILPRHTFFGIMDHIKYIIMFYIIYYIIEHRKLLFSHNFMLER